MRTRSRSIAMLFAISLVLGGCNWLQFRWNNRTGASFDTSVSSSDVALHGVEWSVPTGGAVRSSPAVAFEQVAGERGPGRVYIGSDNNALFAFDADSGTARQGFPTWSTPTGGPVRSSPAVGSGYVFVGSDDGKLYAMYGAGAVVRWTADTGGAISSSPLLNWPRVFVGSADHALYAFDAASGQQLWRASTGGAITSSPARGPATATGDGALYVGSNDGSVYAFDTNGAPLWTRPTGGPVRSSPVVQDGMVIVGSDDGNLYAFDAQSGAELWAVTTGGPISSSPAVANGIVYVGSEDGLFYAVDAATGSERWQTATGGPIFSSPAVASGIVYVGSSDTKLYAFDAVSGVVLRAVETGGAIRSSPAVAEGRVYVGSDDGNLYAFSRQYFRAAASYSDGAPFEIDAADVDRDDDIDLAVASAGDGASLMKNRGDGTFTEPVNLIEGDVRAIALGDVNHDAAVDVVVSEWNPDATQFLVVLLNQGDGTFVIDDTYAVGTNPSALAIGDVDGDSAPDLVAGNAEGIAVLLNEGDGSFAPARFSAIGEATALDLADVDGDGALDIVCVTYGRQTLTVALNDGHAAFDQVAHYDAGIGFAVDVALADFDGDGAPDATVSGFTGSSGRVAVLSNRGDGSYDAATSYRARIPWGDLSQGLAVGDVNDDGFADIAATYSSGSAAVLVNDGAGAFRDVATHHTGGDARDITLADLDGDGALDAATANPGSHSVSVLLHR